MPPPLVSVVTPFYNVVEYLAECIESVLAQTHAHFEYILVDNQSTDGSEKIAEHYAKADSRITVYRNAAFLSQVANYNEALSKISKESVYTKIVEADNWIFPECLDRFVALAESNPKVGLLSSYNITERTVRFAGLHYAKSVWPGHEIARRQLLQQIYVFGAPTTVMMRSDLVRKRRTFFDAEAPIAEDQSACFEILRDHDFAFVHQILAFIRSDNVSILSALRDLNARSLDVVVLLARHGSDFLNDTEMRTEFARARKHHYQVLGRSLILGKGRRMLRYHGAGLATAGLTLNWTSLVVSIVRETLLAVLSPRQFLRAARESFAENRKQNPSKRI